MSQQSAVTDLQSKAPKHIKTLADYLITEKKSKLRPRNGQLNGQRVVYFKGKSGVISIKKAEKIDLNNSEPKELLENLLKFRYIMKCSKNEEDGTLVLTQQDVDTGLEFDRDSYYFWLYRGSALKARLYGLGILVLILLGFLYPLWPNFMRVGTWYLTMLAAGFLIFMVVLGIIRLIFWLFTKVFVPPGIWIFPNLFADCGFFESFVPFYVWDIPQEKKPKKNSKKSTSGKKRENQSIE